MPTTYQLADESVMGILSDTIAEYRHDLGEANVRVGVLMAVNENGHAVKHGGYPATATIKVVPQKDRITKNYDAEIVIDEKAWDAMNRKCRVALLHHELMHMELKRDKEGTIELDDNGRPKLKSRPGDFNAGDGFKEVCAIHGEYAAELQAYRFTLAKAEAAARGDSEAKAA